MLSQSITNPVQSSICGFNKYGSGIPRTGLLGLWKIPELVDSIGLSPKSYAPAAGGTKYYIDKVSGTWRYKLGGWPTSSDTAASLNTIQGCLNDLDGVGNIVIIPPKTYTVADFSASGSIITGSTNTTLQAPQATDIAYPGLTGDVVFDATGATSIFFWINQLGWVINNIKIKDLSTGDLFPFFGQVEFLANDLTIENCEKGPYLANGTLNRPKFIKITGSSNCVFTGAGNTITLNYPIFDGSENPIDLGFAANTVIFNNPIFTRFAGRVFRANFPSTTILNNPMFFGNALSKDLTICEGGASGGAWEFNNGFLAGKSRFSNAFFSNIGGLSTVTYNNTITKHPHIVSNYSQAGTFFIIDDSENYTAFKGLATLAETYRFKAGFAVSQYGSSNINWSEFSGYIADGHDACIHCRTATCLGTPNAFTAAKVGATLTIAVTRTDPLDSTTWTGTLTVSGSAAIDLASTSYNTMRKVAVYLASVGVTMGAGEGQINYATIGAGYEANPLCLASATYDISTVKTVLFEEQSLFHTEIKETKDWLEAQIQVYIPGWVAKSLVWPVGSHSANSIAYALSVTGIEQARGIITDFSDLYALDMGKVAAARPDEIGTNTGTSAERLMAAENFLCSSAQAGSVCGVFAHGYVEADWVPIFETIAAGESNVTAGTFAEIMDWVRDNDDHVTGVVSYRYASEENEDPGVADYNHMAGSSGINSGIVPFVHGAGDQYDAAGYKVWDDTYNIPDGHWIDGVDIGAYAYGGGNKYYTQLTIVSGTTPADLVVKMPAALDIITVLGVDSTWYDASGVPKEVAFADVGDDVLIFAGDKGKIVLYSVDRSDKAAQIHRVIGV